MVACWPASFYFSHSYWELKLVVPEENSANHRYTVRVHCNECPNTIRCPLVLLQYRKMCTSYKRYGALSGASGDILTPLQEEIIRVFASSKHVHADITGSSSSSQAGIRTSSKKELVFKHTTFRGENGCHRLYVYYPKRWINYMSVDNIFGQGISFFGNICKKRKSL